MNGAAKASRTSSVAALVGATAVLYLARDVLIPFALAILAAFLLAPAVRLFERWKLGRVVSAFLVVLLALSLVASIGWIAGTQAVSLAAKLPEYRANIFTKIRTLREPGTGTIAKAQEAIKELEQEAAPSPQQPMPVVQTPQSPYSQLLEFITPFAKPAAMALAVIVFTILMLLHRENMRERLIGLIGSRRINVTTQALSEASDRVSRYLFMQLVMNACFGVPFAVALYFIGIPNAMLWGLLATVLRFIPYAGIWIAVAMPAVLAFAIFDGWSEVTWVLGTFVLLEMALVYVVEPLVYGRSTGLSPIAIILAALFWTWLWGPVGLLLATPLTVCVAVMGRYIPELGYLNVLLGVEPVLTPEARLYQRLVAMDQEEVDNLAEEYTAGHGLASFYDTAAIPALTLAEQDRHAGSLEPARERFLFDALRRLVEDSADDVAPLPIDAGATICIAAAHDEADHVAGVMLARMLSDAKLQAHLVSFPILTAETLDEIGAQSCRLVCISAVPPHAATHAGYLCKRLKKRFPETRIIVALWSAEGDLEPVRRRLVAAGATDVVTRLPAAVETLRQLAVPVTLEQKREQAASVT
jgi:predicted PurR-regulated permease PerM